MDGYYWIIAKDQHRRFSSRLLFVPRETIPYQIFEPPKQQHLAYGRIRFLMAIAEIDAVQRVAH